MRSLKTYLVAALAFASLSATAQTKKVVDRVDQRTVQELDHQDVTTKFKSRTYSLVSVISSILGLLPVFRAMDGRVRVAGTVMPSIPSLTLTSGTTWLQALT